MTREEAIKGLKSLVEVRRKYCDMQTMKDEIECLDMAIKALEQESRWIPVSEKLPKAGEYIGDVDRYYLVQNEYGDMLVARYTHSGYWEQIYQLQPIGDKIVAWMPLPKPYKEVTTDADSD